MGEFISFEKIGVKFIIFGKYGKYAICIIDLQGDERLSQSALELGHSHCPNGRLYGKTWAWADLPLP